MFYKVIKKEIEMKYFKIEPMLCGEQPINYTGEIALDIISRDELIKLGYDCFLVSESLLSILNKEAKEGRVQGKVFDQKLVFSVKHNIDFKEKPLNRKMHRLELIDSDCQSNKNAELMFFNGSVLMSERIYSLIKEKNIRLKRAKITSFEVPEEIIKREENDRLNPIFATEKTNNIRNTIIVMLLSVAIFSAFFRFMGVL